MSERNDGGPAFAQLLVDTHGPTTTKQRGGMSLRDWLAGQALVAIGMWEPPDVYFDEEDRLIPRHMPRYQGMLQESRAKWAYEQADAMLAERDK